MNRACRSGGRSGALFSGGLNREKNKQRGSKAALKIIKSSFTES